MGRRIKRSVASRKAELLAKIAQLEKDSQGESIDPAEELIIQRQEQLRAMHKPFSQGLTESPLLNYDNRILGHQLTITKIQRMKDLAEVTKDYSEAGINRLADVLNEIQLKLKSGLSSDEAMELAEDYLNRFEIDYADQQEAFEKANARFASAISALQEFRAKKAGNEIEESERQEELAESNA